MQDEIIRLTDVSLRLSGSAGPVEVLRDISLSVRRGESVGLIGPSGSGKSSLLMLLGGLDRATSGQVQVLGQELTGLDEDRLARFRRDNMGIVFQSFHLIPTMTALENVAVPLELAGAADAWPRARARLAAVGLSHRESHYPSQMSGGEQQRVALARALAPGPQILLADEPTGNLDGATGAAIVELLFGLVEREGGTLVLVTHDPALAARCARVVRLKDGQIEGETPSAKAGPEDAGRPGPALLPPAADLPGQRPPAIAPASATASASGAPGRTTHGLATHGGTTHGGTTHGRMADGQAADRPADGGQATDGRAS